MNLPEKNTAHKLRRNFHILFLLFILSADTITNAQWVRQSSNTFERLTDVVMLDSAAAIAVGRGRSILRTTDAGKTWVNTTIMMSSVMPWNAVSFCNKQLGVTAGDYQVRISADSGKTWKFGSTEVKRIFLSALFYTPQDLYIGDDSGWVHYSKDTAKTWSSVKISNSPVRSIFTSPDTGKNTFPAEHTIFALAGNTLFIKEGIAEWKEWAQPGFYGLGSDAFRGGISPEGTQFLVGVQGDFVPQAAVLRLRPQDSHWYSVAPFEIGELCGLSIPTDKDIYTCGSDGMLLGSDNGGNDWVRHNTGTHSFLSAVSFYDSKHGFAVGDSGIILFTSNGGNTKPQNFTARYWYGAADSVCETIRPGAKLSSISSLDVLPEGTSLRWEYRFTFFDASLKRAEQLYFHNEQNKIIFDSLSYETSEGGMFISEEWLDSDSALAHAERNGGKEYREKNPEYLIMASLYQPLVPNSYPTWCIYYTPVPDGDIQLTLCFDARKKTTGFEGDAGNPGEYLLYQNYPNPFNPVTKIKYVIPPSIRNGSHVSLKLYSIPGDEIAVLVNRLQKPGTYEVEFDGSRFASGIYIYTLDVDGRRLQNKMCLIK